jgi:hypothetical protein
LTQRYVRITRVDYVVSTYVVDGVSITPPNDNQRVAKVKGVVNVPVRVEVIDVRGWRVKQSCPKDVALSNIVSQYLLYIELAAYECG